MTRFASDGRPLPRPTPTTKPFFDAARERRLRLQRCPRDGFFYYPRTRCPRCWRDDWTWEDVSGRGEVYAVTVDRLGHDPALASRIPFALALVDLEEGPRMPANIVGCEPGDVKVGMKVQADFEDVDELTLVHFRPR